MTQEEVLRLERIQEYETLNREIEEIRRKLDVCRVGIEQLIQLVRKGVYGHEYESVGK